MDRDTELPIVRRIYAKQAMAAASEAALETAFETGRVGEVTRLYRSDDRPDEDCWVRGAGWCLAYH